jgi:hypothetical protein
MNRISERSKLTEMAVLLVFGACHCGCSGNLVPTYPAGGQVVFSDGKPLPGGNIEFAPQEGTVRTSARAMIQEDGTFRLTTFEDGDGAIEGQHRVLIIPARQREDRNARFAWSVDPKYQSFDTSELEATVLPDTENEFKFVVHPAGHSR